MQRYTAEDREAMLVLLIAALADDARVAGVVLVGSGAHGFPDPYADIDLVVVVEEAALVPTVFDAWKRWLPGLVEVLHTFEIRYSAKRPRTPEQPWTQKLSTMFSVHFSAAARRST